MDIIHKIKSIIKNAENNIASIVHFTIHKRHALCNESRSTVVLKSGDEIPINYHISLVKKYGDKGKEDYHGLEIREELFGDELIPLVSIEISLEDYDELKEMLFILKSLYVYQKTQDCWKSFGVL